MNGTKIRITGAKGSEWYAEKIGEVFKTTGETMTIMGVKHHCVEHDGARHKYYVSEDNFEIVSDDENVTVLADESLGGVKREYRHVKRKALVGERIKVTDAYITFGDYENGDIFTVNWRYGDKGVILSEVNEDNFGYILDREYVVLTPTDVIYVDDEDGASRRYRMVDRKANVGELVIVVAAEENTNSSTGIYENGAMFIVVGGGDVFVDCNKGTMLFHREYRVLEPLESEFTPDPCGFTDSFATVTELESKVAEQAAQIDGILGTLAEVGRTLASIESRKLSRVERADGKGDRVPQVGDRVIIVDQTATNIGDAEPNIVNGEAYVIAETGYSDDYPYWLSKGMDGTNGIWCARKAFVFADVSDVVSEISRDEVIERAKADVADLSKFAGTNVPNGERGRHHFWPHTDEDEFYYPVDTVKYEINRGKRTVVALICDSCSVWARGIAKCAPNDVFNVHIGKAIALRRALSLPIPDEYVSAPQPTELQPGDVVARRDGSTFYSGDNTVRVRNIYGSKVWFVTDTWLDISGVVIVDDSRDGSADKAKASDAA